MSIRGATLRWVLLGAALLSVAPASAQTTAVATGRVVGTIIDQANGFTIPGATVEGPGGVAVVSDLDGKFALDLPAGAQTIRFVMDGYATQSVVITVTVGRPVATVKIAMPVRKVIYLKRLRTGMCPPAANCSYSQ